MVPLLLFALDGEKIQSVKSSIKAQAQRRGSFTVMDRDQVKQLRFCH